MVDRFSGGLAALEAEGLMRVEPDRVSVTRDGLLKVDSLLPLFFKPEHRAGTQKSRRRR